VGGVSYESAIVTSMKLPYRFRQWSSEIITYPSVQQAYIVTYRLPDLTPDEEIANTEEQPVSRQSNGGPKECCTPRVASNPAINFIFLLIFAKSQSNFIDIKLTYARYSGSEI
jgi:hypothetical protein